MANNIDINSIIKGQKDPQQDLIASLQQQAQQDPNIMSKIGAVLQDLASAGKSIASGGQAPMQGSKTAELMQQSENAKRDALMKLFQIRKSSAADERALASQQIQDDLAKQKLAIGEEQLKQMQQPKPMEAGKLSDLQKAQLASATPEAKSKILGVPVATEESYAEKAAIKAQQKPLEGMYEKLAETQQSKPSTLRKILSLLPGVSSGEEAKQEQINKILKDIQSYKSLGGQSNKFENRFK